jgi:hypothetical protein
MPVELTPPSLAERVLRWSLPEAEQAAVLGDVQEEFAALAETRDRATADRWYWRQATTSVVPNLLRAFRQQIARISRIIDDADRRSRRRRRWVGAAVFALGVWISYLVANRRPDEWQDGLPFMGGGVLIALTGSYRAMSFARTSRRGRIGSALMLLTLPFIAIEVGSGHSVSTSLVELRFGIYGLQILTWMWPQGTWPFHRPRTDELSMRAPVLLRWKRDQYETVTLPAQPSALSGVLVGRPIAAGTISAPTPSGVTPMAVSRDRVFSAGENLRLFAVINAPSESVTASLEIRRAMTGRLLGALPAVIRPGVPLLTKRQLFRLDPDDDPIAPPEVHASEIDASISLAGLTPDDYDLRLVLTTPDGTSYEHVEIEVCGSEALQ